MDYLHYLKTQSQTPSASYFKHTVYGLSFAYRVMGMKNPGISLPALKSRRKLPVVLSREEVRLLLITPKLLKHRLVIGMLYGCGLRRFELLNVKLQDVDLDRKMLHIREGKGGKDRYVPIGEHLTRGLKTYIESERPYIWLFNGKDNTGQLQQFSTAGVQWILKEANKRSGIKKHITSHVLRHTYATHLLEMGLDIMTIKDLLGHVDITTTLIYLHVAQLDKQRGFNPIDVLYPMGKKASDATAV